ncbi:MAG: hypothetical protein ACK5Z2_00135 [Bacteroidota bacterium]|jgi:hypothetical protein
MKKQKKEILSPIRRTEAKQYVMNRLRNEPSGSTCYVEMRVADIISLIENSGIENAVEGRIRVYLGKYNDGRDTVILVASQSAFIGSIEMPVDDVIIGENFGTLCPPYNIENDPGSLASEIISELVNIPRPLVTKKKDSKKKK